MPYDMHDLLGDDEIFIMKPIISNELLKYLTMLILLSITNEGYFQMPHSSMLIEVPGHY